MSLGPMQAVFSTLDLLRKQENADFNDAQTRKKAKWDDEDRAVKMEEVTRAKKLREELENEAKPVEVETVEADGPVRPAGITDKDGNALTPEAQPTMARVGSKTYVNQNEAGAAAETHNAPGAVMQRQSRRLLQAGNPQAAATLAETGMKLDAQMSADIDRRFNEDVERNVTDWGTAAKFATQSAFDGGAGQIQYRFAEMPDGTMQPQVSVDGQNWQSDPKGRSYKKDATGFQEAKLDLLRIPTDKKLAHLYGRAKAEDEAKQQEFKNKQEERRTVAYEKQVDAQAELRAAQGALAEARAEGRVGGTDGSKTAANPGAIDMAELDKELKDLFTGKDGDGNKSYDATAHTAVRELIPFMPGYAEGDGRGALLGAYTAYQQALEATKGNTPETANGDTKKAVAMIRAAAQKQAAAQATARKIRDAAAANGDTDYNVQLGGKGAQAFAVGSPGPMTPEQVSMTAVKKPAANAGASAPGAAPAAPPLSMRDAAVATAGQDKALQSIMASKIPAVEQAIQAHQQAKQVMRAAAASGDQRSVALYAKRLQDARAALIQSTAGLPPAVQAQALAEADK